MVRAARAMVMAQRGQYYLLKGVVLASIVGLGHLLNRN
jgi:hypothetical protein